jgi:DNA primase
MNEWVSFSEVKNRVTLERALRSYRVDWLRRSGPRQYRGRCPIHGGHGMEAFHANLERGVFHCFACGAGGNVIDFVAAMEDCSIREAALRLQAIHGDGRSGGRAQRVAASSPETRKLVTKKREVNPPLRFSLHLDPVHPYLAERGIDMATASYFGVGYFRGRGLMSGRVAIPIRDHESRLVAYCGRAVDGAFPRYRFPMGFHKSQVLFNHHRARATGNDQVIVVEGFFDCMRVHQAGFGCVVALMGARLSVPQRAVLVEQYREIILMLDGDPTGRSATAQIASDLAPARTVTEALLAPGVQPDQMTCEQIRRILREGKRRRINPRELTMS